MKIDQTKLYNDLNTNNTDEISGLLRIGKIKTSLSTKSDKIDYLMKFLTDESFIIDYINSLDECDTKILNHIYQYNYHPIYKDIRSIYEEYQIKPDSDYGALQTKSRIKLLCVKKENMNSARIYDGYKYILDKVLTKSVFEVKIVEEQEMNGKYTVKFEGVNNFLKMDDLIRYVGANKVTVSKVHNKISVATALKIVKTINLEEYYKSTVYSFDDETYTNASKVEEFGLLYPLVNLLKCSNLMSIENNIIKLDSTMCTKYLALSKVKQASFLLDKYLNSKSIKEFDRFNLYKITYDTSINTFIESRKMVLDYLKTSEIDRWIDTNSLRTLVRMNHYLFLRDNDYSEVTTKSAYGFRYDQTLGHGNFENAFIDYIIQDYLYPLGIVEICSDNMGSYFDDRQHIFPSYYKITKFGAMVLGLIKEEETHIKSDDTLIVTKDFEIILNGDCIVHNIYFNRFLEQKKNNYVITPKSISKGISMDIQPKDLLKYLIDNTTKVPSNVTDQLLTWQEEHNNILIKNSNVVALDKETYDLIKNDKSFKKIIDEETHYLVIRDSKEEDLKKLIYSKNKIVIDKLK